MSWEMDDADMHRRLRAPTSLGSEADRIIELFQKNRPHATPAEIYFTITAMPLVAIKQAEQKAAQGNAEMVGTGPDIQPLADKVSATWAAFAHGQSEQWTFRTGPRPIRPNGRRWSSTINGRS
jgi:hypothetical protein